MAQIKRFGYGLQAMLVLSSNDKLLSSTDLADLIQYETTQLRKILSLLVETKLLSVQQGRGGGYFMVKDAKEVTLMDIYAAVNPGMQPEWHRLLATTGGNFFGKQVNNTFEEISAELSSAVKVILEKYTLYDLHHSNVNINL